MNTVDIITLVGLAITALVTIFSKVREQPLTQAQAATAEADAAVKLSEGWRNYANQIREDNTALRKEMDELRDEMEAKAKACADKIAELERQVNGHNSARGRKGSREIPAEKV